METGTDIHIDYTGDVTSLPHYTKIKLNRRCYTLGSLISLNPRKTRVCEYLEKPMDYQFRGRIYSINSPKTTKPQK